MGKPALAAGTANPAIIPARRPTIEIDLKAMPFGSYDSILIAAVQKRWYELLDQRKAAREDAGRVVVEFRLKHDGHVSDLTIARRKSILFRRGIASELWLIQRRSRRGRSRCAAPSPRITAASGSHLFTEGSRHASSHAFGSTFLKRRWRPLGVQTQIPQDHLSTVVTGKTGDVAAGMTGRPA